MNYLKEHANEPGCVLYYLDENILPIETIKQAMPADMLTGRFKDLLRWYGIGVEPAVYQGTVEYE